jgi:hypothetical protein
MFRGNESVTVIGRSAGSVDEYGIPIQTETTTVVANCLVEYDSTDEPVTNDADPIVQGATVYMPLPSVVDPMDEFIIGGDVWVKNGAVVEWRSPFSRPVEYAVIKVRRRLG